MYSGKNPKKSLVNTPQTFINSDEDERETIKMFRINFETNSREFIVGWENANRQHNPCNWIKGSFLYIPIDLNSNCASSKHRHFRAIYLDKEISNENCTQFIRSYEKVLDGKSRSVYHCDEVPKYANRWTELFYNEDADGYQERIHFYRIDPSLKSKIDHIRNSVCIATFILVLEQYFV